MPPAPIPGRHINKVAIVTGSGQGIGRGVADRLAAEGAHVIIAEYNQTTAESAAHEIQKHGWKATAYPCDIGDTDQIDKLVRDITQQFGHIDILVNNAGISKTQGLLEITPESWDTVNRVNQRGLFFLLTTVAKQMIAQVPDAVKQAERADQSYGKIVNFSSIAGRSGRPYSAHYSATKWAVISITQSAAKYLAPYNINVNAVCPGVAMTPMWEDIDRTQAARFGLNQGEWFQKTVEGIPLKRAGTPADIAAAVSFLCSADADYITGQTLNVDGGIEMN
jgi:meso-butanediol dehydrogenase / (S,S)-butanediol dehydrogenase / diacetyl reductase